VKDFRQSALEIAARRGFTNSINALQNPLFTSGDSPAQDAKKPGATIAFKPPQIAPEGTNTPPKNVVHNVINKSAPRASVKVLKAGSTLPALAPASRTLEGCWDEAAAQLEPYRLELGKCWRLALGLRALALFQNPHVKVRTATLVTFCPASALAFWLGFSESYLWKLQNEAHNGGAQMFTRLIGHRPWFTSWERWSGDAKHAQTVKGGCVWSVRATPTQDGAVARVLAEDTRHAWRDLSADVQHGRTLPRQLLTLEPQKRSRGLSTVSKYPEEKCNVLIKTILLTSLSRFSPANAGVTRDTGLSEAPDIYAVLHDLNELPHGSRDARGEWVNGLARRVCAVLGESEAGNGNGWRKALWTALKASLYGMPDALNVLHAALWEAVIVSGDNPRLRRRGALARSLMTANGWRGFEDAVRGFHAGREVRA
jgi:hypothetical protein